MHIPDGFINGPTSLGAGVFAASGIGVGLRRTAEQLQERQAPLAGLVAAFIFAGQMINFPVAAGTSGHLLGGVLAAVLIGPWAAVVCVAVVLTIQALLFADGGLTALGLNVTNMALLGTLGGWLVFRALRAVAPKRRAIVGLLAGFAAALSVPLAAVGFVVEYAIGGTGNVPIEAVGWAMIGTHVLIGIGEGVITALTVGAVLGVRPDLVHGARHTTPAGPISHRGSDAP